MAAVVHTVSEALTICGVNKALLFQGHTAATRLATDIFIDTYESMKDKTFAELDADFKSYSDLTAIQGQIRLLPGVKRNIKSLIQWVQDQFRTGLNPQDNVFPIADVTLLLRRQKSHALFIMKSKIIVDSAKPTKYSDSTKWDDWNPTFVNFLRSIPGRDGVPLSYVTRKNATPDPTPHLDFLDDYVAMAPLSGESFVVDSAEVHTYLTSFTSGNSTAEAKMKPHSLENNGRLDYTALANHYEGVGINSIDILRADEILDKLFYQGEKKPHMWWEQFEIDLDFAFNAYSRSEGRDIHSESMRLRILTKKVNADFLATSKAAIMTQMTAIPMNMTYIQALATFRQEVNRKFPPSISSRRPTRRVQQSERGRGRGRGIRGRGGRFPGRGRGGGRGIHNKRKMNTKHPHSYPVTLIDGTGIDVHASYYFGSEIWNKLPPHEAARITNDRNEYKRQNATRALASLNAQIPSVQNNAMVPYALPHNQYPQYYVQGTTQHQSIPLPPLMGGQVPIPPPPPPQTGSTMMGGRNERALNSTRHNQGA